MKINNYKFSMDLVKKNLNIVENIYHVFDEKEDEYSAGGVVLPKEGKFIEFDNDFVVALDDGFVIYNYVDDSIEQLVEMDVTVINGDTRAIVPLINGTIITIVQLEEQLIALGGNEPVIFNFEDEFPLDAYADICIGEETVRIVEEQDKFFIQLNKIKVE